MALDFSMIANLYVGEVYDSLTSSRSPIRFKKFIPQYMCGARDYGEVYSNLEKELKKDGEDSQLLFSRWDYFFVNRTDALRRARIMNAMHLINEHYLHTGAKLGEGAKFFTDLIDVPDALSDLIYGPGDAPGQDRPRDIWTTNLTW